MGRCVELRLQAGTSSGHDTKSETTMPTDVQVDVPFGAATTVELAVGQTLRIEVVEGNQPGDLSFLGFDQGLTRDINGFTAFGRPVLPYHAAPGMVLVDGEGDGVLDVGPLNAEGNDIMLPGCRREVYADGRDGCRDLIAAALGVTRGELTGMLSFFCLGTAHDDHYDGLAGTSAQPGAWCSFVARRPVVVGVSACPGSDIPGFTPGVLQVGVS